MKSVLTASTIQCGGGVCGSACYGAGNSEAGNNPAMLLQAQAQIKTRAQTRQYGFLEVSAALGSTSGDNHALC